MPYYVVLVKGKGNKTYSLPEKVFAPCAGEAWDEATKILPKGVKIVDVVPEEQKRRN